MRTHWPALVLMLLAPAPAAMAAGEDAGTRCLETAIGDSQAALPIAAQGLADARARVDRRAESQFLRCEGYAREQLGETSAALARYDQAVTAAQLSRDDVVLAAALVSRGELRHFSGDYGAAIDDLTRAYELNSRAGTDRDKAYMLNAIANLYADANVGEYDKAIDYYQQLLAEHIKAGRRSDMATALFNIGSTLERKGDLAGALANYRRAFEIDKSLAAREGMAEEQRVIGGVLVKQGKAAQALPRIEEALSYYRGSNDPDGVARVQLARGIALRAAGSPSEALADLDASRAYFLAEGNQRFLVRIAEERAHAFADLKQWQAAYEALGEQFKAQREIDRKLAEERTARLRVQFGAEQTEKKYSALQVESDRRGLALRVAERVRALQRQVIVLGLLLLAVVAALALRQLWKSRRLRELALTDDLTGLPNRRNIFAFLEQQARLARRSEHPLSVVSFDIDHFKAVNDQHGHDGGDRALTQLARVASDSLRETDRLGRVGGEEFLLVLPNTGSVTASEIAERLREAIESADFDQVAPGQRLAISAGVAAWGGPREATEALVKRADEALYHAKSAGRNRVERG